MKAKLGLRAVAALPPNSILWDEKVSGFNARRQFSDVITYSVIYRTNDGVQRWMKIGRHPILTPELARKEAIKILRSAALGNDPSAERYELRHGMTVAQLCDDYIADMTSEKVNGKKATTIRTDISRIKNHIRPELGKFKVATIASDQIEQFMNAQSRGSAKRIIALTGAIFSFAIKRKLRFDNPCRGIEKPADVKRLRRLSNDEYGTLHRALDNVQSTVSDCILFVALTGWRASEARCLKWSEIDIDRRVATLGDTKSGLSIRPLSMAAIEIIKRRPSSAQFVFAMQTGLPMRNLSMAFQKLGMPEDVTPHTLRHSYASLAGDLGLPDATIAGLLGHRQQSMTSRYMHLGDKALLDASDVVANATLRLMEGRQ